MSFLSRSTRNLFRATTGSSCILNKARPRFASSTVVDTKLNERQKETTNSVSLSSPHLEMIIPTREAIIAPPLKDYKSSKGFVVKRLLPYQKKRTVGSFIFVDDFSMDMNETMYDVAPHPHIGLATLTYLYYGASLHRDSTGAEQLIVPGQVNLMIAGKGVVHSERNIVIKDKIPILSDGRKWQHGLQIWIALTKEDEFCEPSFHHVESVPEVTEALQFYPANNSSSSSTTKSSNSKAHLLIGSFAGIKSSLALNASYETFLVDLALDAGDSVVLPLCEGIEFAVYTSIGSVSTSVPVNDGKDCLSLKEKEAAVLSVSKNNQGKKCGIRITNNSATSPARIAFFGGKPLPEPRYIFWNFVATSKEIIAKAADNWQKLDRKVFPNVVNEDNTDSIPLPAKS